MKAKVSRRIVSAALLGVPALAQAPPAGSPKPQEQDLRAAASIRIQNTAARLREFEIAVETEPAFRFEP